MTGNGRPVLEEFEMTESEIMNAQILPDPLLKLCKTNLATESMRARNLVPDPDSYSRFIQQKAYLDGAISVWEFLINTHYDTIRKLATE